MKLNNFRVKNKETALKCCVRGVIRETKRERRTFRKLKHSGRYVTIGELIRQLNEDAAIIMPMYMSKKLWFRYA